MLRASVVGGSGYAGGELVRLLLDHKADPALTNATGQTPAEVARAADHDDIAALLASFRTQQGDVDRS